MKKLPPKLFELGQNGVSEEDIQHIFDALVHAEEERIQFVNVYFHDAEPSFLFTNDRPKADQQLRAMIDRAKKQAFGFEASGETWQERP